jgi:hypothetical protein
MILLGLLLLLIYSTTTRETFISIDEINEIRNYKGKVTDTYDTIDNPISDSLIPYNPNMKVELNEYDVIEIFKTILQRPPTIQEMKKNVYLTSNNLKEYLYNSPEYDKLIKTQDNHVNNGIEGAIAKRNLLNRIMLIYSNITSKELPIKMMMPLRDCFIHLQLNDFLFTAMLESLNYMNFQVDVLSTYVLTKKKLLELFDKHYNVLELKLVAQDKINRINKKSKDFSIDIENIKKSLVNIKDTKIIDKIKDSFPNTFNELLKSTFSDDIDTATISTEKKAVSSGKTDIDQINDYLKNNIEKFKTNNTNNTNNTTNTTNTNNTNNTNNEKFKTETKSNEKIEEKLTLNEKIINLPDNTELYVRVYNPSKRNTSYANIPDGYKPPICTSLGQESLTQPIFTESKLLFQGTDLNTAFEDSQVGSIMPKFIYKEYKDVKIN